MPHPRAASRAQLLIGMGFAALAMLVFGAAGLVVGQPPGEYLAIGLAGALLFGVCGTWLAGRLTRPLREVAHQAQALLPDDWRQATSATGHAFSQAQQLSAALGRLPSMVIGTAVALFAINVFQRVH